MTETLSSPVIHMVILTLVILSVTIAIYGYILIGIRKRLKWIERNEATNEQRRKK